MAVTLQDVATLAGVSVSAVSRVLRDDPAARVTADTSARIKAAAESLRYSPNFAGRALKMARTNTIALIVPDLTNSIFTDLAMGVEDGAGSAGYALVLGRAEGLDPASDNLARLIAESRVDGLVVQARDDADVDAIINEVGSRIPMVVINTVVESGGASSISLDDRGGARIGVEQLLEAGHRRIGLLGGHPSTATAAQRELGYQDALLSGGIPVEEALIRREGYSVDEGRRAFRDLFAGGTDLTALYVANVNAALGALKEARASGISVPADLSIIAMHDSSTAEHSWPPLTTVRMPLYEMGAKAVELLGNSMRTGAVQHLVLDAPSPRIMVRESVAAPKVVR